MRFIFLYSIKVLENPAFLKKKLFSNLHPLPLLEIAILLNELLF